MTSKSRGSVTDSSASPRKKQGKKPAVSHRLDFNDGTSDGDTPIDLSPNSPMDDDFEQAGEEREDKEDSLLLSPSNALSPTRGNRRIRRNYKNMSRQRRIEANARERTRVHLISAAFDSLRQAVPAYAHNQRLSKLAVLRVACSYIMALSRLADDDVTGSSSHSSPQRRPTFAECVDICTQTIQMEGKPARASGRAKGNANS